MPNDDEIIDIGVVDPAGLPHEQVAKLTDRRVADVFETVKEINARTARIEGKVDRLTEELTGLALMVGRTPTGQTVGAAVQQILEKVKEI
jgi:hypothetical protein